MLLVKILSGMLLVDLLRDVVTEILSGDLFMRKAFGKGFDAWYLFMWGGRGVEGRFPSGSFYAGAGTRRRAHFGMARTYAYVPGETVGARVQQAENVLAVLRLDFVER